MSKIDSSNIEYLALEGGGGKGVIYSGAISSLQRLYQAKLRNAVVQAQNYTEEGQKFVPWTSTHNELPLFPIWHTHPNARPLKGVAGSSAGAITAFFLAMGLSHADLVKELNVVITKTLAGARVNSSEFEGFFDEPAPDQFREFSEPGFGPRPSSDANYRNKKLLDWYQNFLAILKAQKFAEGVESMLILPRIFSQIKGLRLSLNRFLLSSMLNDSYLAKRLLLTDVVWSPALHAKLNSTSNDPAKISTVFWKGEALRKELELLLQSDNIEFGGYNKLASFAYCITNDRGLFSGIAVRTYLANRLQKYLIEKAKGLGRSQWLGSVPFSAETMTFTQFFHLTGVDLVLTGTNILQNIPVYFSRTHTPDFPVVDAVGASMSIPGLFKPVKIKGRVQKHLETGDINNMKYYGMIVDGGMLNNYPINAFNGAKASPEVMYHGTFGNYILQSPISDIEPFDGKTLGLRLQQLYRAGFHKPADYLFGKSPKPGQVQSETSEDEFIPFHKREYNEAKLLIDPDADKSPFFDFLGQILETFAFPAENGQVRSQLARECTLLLDTGQIGITDFSNPVLDDQREFIAKAQMKRQLVANAAKSVENNVI